MQFRDLECDRLGWRVGGLAGLVFGAGGMCWDIGGWVLGIGRGRLGLGGQIFTFDRLILGLGVKGFGVYFGDLVCDRLG